MINLFEIECLCAEILSFSIDMLIELCSLLIIDRFELFEEAFFLGSITNRFIVFNEMFLFVLFDSVKDISLHYDYVDFQERYVILK